HGVPPQDVRAGARRLARALPFTPPGVHLAVVDPGVGGARRAVALRTGDRWLVGPDNGLLIDAAERFGGVAEAFDGGASPWRLEASSVQGRPVRVARTFGDVEPGALLLYTESSGELALAVNGGSAAALLGVKAGDELCLT